MKFLYKGILIASLALCVTSATAFATETQEVTPEKENISFDYKENKFDIDPGTGAGAKVELTVMLVKGDYVSEEVSLSDISVSDIYYIGQETGTNYDVFDGLGVKYVSNKFKPGVYTLITNGQGVEMIKTKLVIGNALSKEGFGDYLPADLKTGNYEFGSVSQTARYYPAGENGNYIYVCYASFPSFTNLENVGFLFQNITGEDIKYLVKPLSAFNRNDALDNINTNAGIEIGVQINDIPATGENAVENIVAIPYVQK